MGIYFGCYCFNMTNGHASSCVAQFIYADIIGPLKWNIQWAICQKFKVDLTWSLLQSCSSSVPIEFAAKCKPDEYSWVGDIIIRQEATWYSRWNTSSCISLAYIHRYIHTYIHIYIYIYIYIERERERVCVCVTSSGRNLKVRKKCFWFQMSETDAISQSVLIEEFCGLKDTEQP